MWTMRIYRDRKGEWRWRIVARNGRIVADSGEGYSSASAVRRAASRFLSVAAANLALMKSAPIQ